MSASAAVEGEACESTGMTLCILGAAGDTTNLGVDALLESTLVGLRRSMPEASFVVFDNGLGRREGSVDGPGFRVDFERLGIRVSRRVHRPESLTNMAVSARIGVPPNRAVRLFRSSAAVVDLSGGDSFSDLYGARRFEAMTKQKDVALRAGASLVLLPQTYGPFARQRSQRVAAGLVRRASSAWARDAESFDVLRSLLGSEFDERRHHLGVDVAFALPSRRPEHLDQRIADWLSAAVPVFGFNVSGLLANDELSHREFDLRENYGDLVRRTIRLVLDETGARVVLVPHVLSDLWVVESDVAACRRLAGELAAEYGDRIAVLEGIDRAQDVKWVIGRCDAFCGTRMHSTIAALSTRTPALAFAYSPKTQGVFASCGQAERVADLRRADRQSVEQQVIALWNDRRSVVAELEATMPEVERRAIEPFDAVRELAEPST